MAKGKAKTTHLGIQGVIGHRNAPDWSFIYETSLTKAPHWNIGDHVVLPDGREFVYSKSSDACISGQGCEFVAVGVNPYTVAGVAQAIGDKELTVPAAIHDAFTEDELRGGYVVIYDGSGNNVQFRGIIGNDATDANVAFKIYLDGPLTEAIVVSTSAIEAFQNPYAALRTGSALSYFPVAGVPAVKITAADTYFWVQKNGPVWIAPHDTVIENHGKGCYWRDTGAVCDPETSMGVTVTDGATSQYAGHLIEGDYAGIGPLFMLQG